MKKRPLTQKAANFDVLFPSRLNNAAWQSDILAQAALIMQEAPRLQKRTFFAELPAGKCYCTFGAIRRAIAEWEWNERPEHDFPSKRRDSEDALVAPFSLEIQAAFGQVLESSLTEAQRSRVKKYSNELVGDSSSKAVILLNDLRGTRKTMMVGVLKRATVLARSMVGHRREKK
jgi:hypothetical protein